MVTICRASGTPVNSPDNFPQLSHKKRLEGASYEEINSWAEKAYGPLEITVEMSLEAVISHYGPCIVRPTKTGYDVTIYDDYLE